MELLDQKDFYLPIEILADLVVHQSVRYHIHSFIKAIKMFQFNMKFGDDEKIIELRIKRF